MKVINTQMGWDGMLDDKGKGFDAKISINAELETVWKVLANSGCYKGRGTSM